MYVCNLECIYASFHVCMHVCVHLSMCVCMYACAWLLACLLVCVSDCVSVRDFTCTPVYVSRWVLNNCKFWVCGLPELLPETCLYFFLEVGPKVRPRTTKVATAVLLTRANLEA